MNAEASALVIELASEFMQLLQSLDPNWTEAYYRFRAEELRYGANASYATPSDVFLVGAIKHGSFYKSANEKGMKLLSLLDKQKGVFLLSVDNKRAYKIQFEWDDLKRWEISMSGGRTGIPEGAL